MPPEDNQNEIEEQVLEDDISVGEINFDSDNLVSSDYIGDLQSHITFNDGQSTTLYIDGDTEAGGPIYISQGRERLGQVLFINDKTKQLSTFDSAGNILNLCLDLKTGQIELSGDKIKKDNKEFIERIKNIKKVSRCDLLDLD